MFKFNNNHIFTGYLKQLLCSFHLPKCKVYTKEQQAFAEASIEKSERIKIDINKLLESINNIEQDIIDINNALATTDLTDDYREFLNNSKQQLENKKTTINQEISSLNIELMKPSELNVMQSNYHSSYDIYPGSMTDLPLTLSYPKNIRYIPYIKDGKIQTYVENKWQDSHLNNNIVHNEFHTNKKLPYITMSYSYGQKIVNYTKNLKIQNTIYDSYTHEYLGDYLRFHRDFANIDLMPLYNCFSNRACPHLDLKFNIGNSNYEVKFKTDQLFENTLYKYYMVPVKFFKDYTIAIDSSASVEVCCCIYDEYHNNDLDFADLPKLTYQCFSDMQFKNPVLYSKIQNLTSLVLNNDSDLCQHEDNLKLIIKLPANNNSSIVILEGNYTTFNDTIAKFDEKNRLIRETNKTVINYDSLEACELLANKLITPLQLLRTNTGESYPFADRLVEYLIGNAITVNETIADNIIRAKTVISANCNKQIANMDANDGIWEPILQCMVYDYINEKQNLNDINHDILGFIDKDVEKWYTTEIFERDKYGRIKLDTQTGKPLVSQRLTISSVDIYNE